MRPLEKLLFVVVSLLFLHLVSTGTNLRWYAGQMDNILAVSVVENIHKRGEPVFQEVGLREALSLMPLPPEKLCVADLSPPKNEYDSIIKWHAYIILYLISPFLALFSSVSLISFLTVLSFYFLLAGSYVFLRRKGVPVLLSLTFVFLLMAHPAWSQSLLGQLYVDRLFLGAFFLLILLIDNPKRKIYAIFIAGVLCSLVNDRLGLICGAFIFGYCIMFFRESSISRAKLLLTALTFVTYSIFVMKFVIENEYYGGFLSILSPRAIANNLANTTFRHNLYTFLFVNLPLFGLFGLFRWKALILAIGLMLPNMFGSIGGAEKVGWSTHYHTTYFPVLVWASASGFSVLALLCKRFSSKVVLGLGALVLAYYQIVLPLEAPLKMTTDVSRFRLHSLAVTARDILDYNAGTGTIYSHLAFGEAVKAVMPPGSSLSTAEYVMPLFYDYTKLFYYPIGLYEADYVLIPFDINLDGSRDLHGFFSYLPLSPEEISTARSCFRNRLVEAGYNIDTPALIWNKWALLKKERLE